MSRRLGVLDAPPEGGMTIGNAIPRSRGANTPELFRKSPSKNKRAQGRPGASSHPRSACIKGSTRQNHRCGRIIRPSLRNGFTAYFALSPGTGLFCPRHFHRNCALRKLSASVGAPGPHAFAVRFKRRSSCVAKASTASRPTFVTTRTPLLSRRDGGNNTHFPIFRKRNISAWRTDNADRIELPQQISIYAHAIWPRKSRVSEAMVRKIEQILPVGQISLR